MEPSRSSHPLPGFERSLAVVIGINAYAHGVPPLHTAVHDANVLADVLARQGFEVIRLLDAQASLSALTALLSHQLPSLQPPPDRVLFYFAGHGLAHTNEHQQLSGFLLPADARRDELSSYWPMDSLREALSRLRCRHLLLVLDCCFAGAFPRASFRDLRSPQPQALPLFIERFNHFASRRSFQLLASTSHDELASDRLLSKPSQEALGADHHSPFARVLIEALQPSSPADHNQDGLLTASELYTFLRDRLLFLLPSHAQQTPALRQLEWHDGGEFLFLLSDAFPSLPSAAPLSRHSNPYLGLRPFSSEHRHLFFGRERVIELLAARLKSKPFLLLCGPSGAGKSSLVQAGLIPHLREQASWLVPSSLRPSAHPLQQLVSWLAALPTEPPVPSAEELAAHPHRAADFLRSWLLGHPNLSVLLVVDPLEELVTACLDEPVRQSFLRALSSMLQLTHPGFHLLLLLRSDFEQEFHSSPSLSPLPAELWREGRFLLPPMNREELRHCIQKPAEASVLFFSSGLVEHLLNDVEQMPGALPLLSVALSALFDKYLGSGRMDRTLRAEDYEALGGSISGALRSRAESVLSGEPPPSSEGQSSLPAVEPEELPAFQRTLRNVLLRMVSPEAGELARRRVPRDELRFTHPAEDARVQRALAALEANRLVVASDEGGPSVEPAHDALLSAWPSLKDSVLHSRHELVTLRRISHAASEWLRQKRAVTSLWADNRLTQLGLPIAALRNKSLPLALPTAASRGQPAEPLTFNAAESDFLRTSAARLQQLRNRRYAITLTVVISLLALTLTALLNAREANRQAALALEKNRFIQIQQLLERDPTKALLFIRETQGASEGFPGDWLRLATEINEQAISSAILIGHQGPVTAALASPKGRHVLTASWDHTVRIWSVDGGGAPLILRGHEGKVISASFSPDSRHVLTTSEDFTARVWSTDGQSPPRILRHQTQRVYSGSFSHKGNLILTTSADGTVSLWRMNGPDEPLVLARHTQPVISAAFSPDDQEVITASFDGTAQILRVDGQEAPRVLKGHKEGLFFASFSPDGEYAVTASADDTARIWSVKDQRELFVLRGHTNDVTFAAFTESGHHVLTASEDGTARVWTASDGAAQFVLRGHTHPVRSVALSPQGGEYLLTASEDGTARLWRWTGLNSSRGSPRILRGHTDRVSSATFSPDGLHVLTASHDGTARVWNVGRERKRHAMMHKTGLLSTTSSPDGQHVVTTSFDKTARVWRADGQGDPVILAGHTAQIGAATFSHDGRRVATASLDNTARVWNAERQDEPVVLRGHTSSVRSAAFSPDDQYVGTASADGTALIWSSTTGNKVLELRGHSAGVNSAAFSPNGRQVVTASGDRTARVWRLEGQGEPVILRGHELDVNSASFSPDGSRVVTASLDNTARIWRADGQGEPLVLRGHASSVYSASFSPDGRYVVTSSYDQTARIWPADGQGQPLILQGHLTAEMLSAVFSADGTHILIGDSFGRLRRVPITTEALRASFTEATTACLSAAERADLFGESPEEARDSRARCERAHHRTP